MKHPLSHCCFFGIAEADETKPLGALLIGDHLYVSDSATGAEEANKLRLAEDEGQVGDVKAASETFVNLPEAFLLLREHLDFFGLLLVHGVSSVKGQRLKIGRWLGEGDAVVGNW